MEIVLLIALGVAVVIIFLLLRRGIPIDAPIASKEKRKLPGIRREAALEREIPKSNNHLFTREVTAGNRRFFFDIEVGERGKYLRISEIEQVRGKQEKAYTLIVFEREIGGFYKALRDSADKLNSLRSVEIQNSSNIKR